MAKTAGTFDDAFQADVLYELARVYFYYGSFEGALKMLSKSLAKDWGKYGIRVNNLGPGYIRTNMTSKTYLNKKLKNERAMHTMLGRWGTKDDLVGPCIFLASDASNYITGQDVYVDGGWLVNSIITE